MGDGCAMEGISNEAASLATHWKLNKLTLIYDDNHVTIDGDTSLAFSEDVSGRFKALGWNTITVDNGKKSCLDVNSKGFNVLACYQKIWNLQWVCRNSNYWQ